MMTSNKRIPLIGGPKNGEIIELPTDPTLKLIDFPYVPDGTYTYELHETKDGYLYGVIK